MQIEEESSEEQQDSPVEDEETLDDVDIDDLIDGFEQDEESGDSFSEEQELIIKDLKKDLSDKKFNIDIEEVNNNLKIKFLNDFDLIQEIKFENEDKKDTIVDELDAIAKKIESATSPLKSFTEPNEDDDYEYRADVTSETLAKIYEMQEAYNDAIETYEKLIEINPEKEEKYKKKIKKLKKKMK
jgi:tetratricopeptide (TPR) repeat protein